MGFFQACKDFLGIESGYEDYESEGEFYDGSAEDAYENEAPATIYNEEEEEPLMDGGFFSSRKFTNKKSDRINTERSNNRVNTNNNLKVVLCNPTEFDNCPMICGHLRSHMTVVLNLESVKSATEKRRIFDFVSGCCFALDCNIRKISEAVYVVAPSNVDLLSEVDFADAAKDTTNYFATDYDL